MHEGPALLAPLLLLMSALPAQASAQSERRLTDEVLEPLAQALAGYAEARASGVGVDAAKSALLAALDALGERLDGSDPLRFPADLGRAAWLARRYDAVEVRPGRVATDVVAPGGFGEGVELAWRLPDDYRPRERAYPLILAIPDQDERPAEHLRTHWTLPALRDGAILVSVQMPSDREEWTRVMVDGRAGGLCHVLTALRLAAERFAVDFDRVYVAGRGKSVPAALSAGDYGPQLFAGVIGRAGDASALAPDNFRNLPTWLSGAGANASAFQEAGRAIGIDHCVLHADGTEEDLWGWILEHPRRAWPQSATVVPGDPFPTRTHWLRIAPTRSDARATAAIDRERNAVRIDGQGVARATLYLSDALLDLDRPLTVVCNGLEQTVVVRRHLPTLLDLLADGTSDPACVYTASADFDMTGAQPVRAAAGAPGEDEEVERRLAAAEGDLAKLWDLHLGCVADQRSAASERALRRIVRLDPDHEGARAALGHRREGERWFTSQAALEIYRRSQDPELARSKGHVLYKGQWLHPDERALASKGLVEDPESGLWHDAADRKRLAAGWLRQDHAWIPPEQAGRVDDGLWWVDGEWLDLASADRRHASLDAPWRIPGAQIDLVSTASREVSLWARWHMERALVDLQRVFGAEPVLPLSVALVHDEEQYDRMAFGAPDGRRPPAHAGRLHVIHYGFFAESWFPRVEGRREFHGMGVGYWDTLVPNGDLYGVHSARLAAGLSFVDALDPSPKAVRKALADGPQEGYYEAWLAEKRLPPWLRFGGAVYAERFFRDESVGAEADPWWPRAWSLDNLRSRGGLRALPEVLAFPLDPDQREDGLKLLIEAGLVVAFVVDGGCAPVEAAHAELKQALVRGRVHARDLEALTDALLAHEAELRAFAAL